MDSFEANKIFGALLGTVFVLFGGSLLAEAIFHAEAPETPGYAIQAAEPAAGGGAAAPAADEVTPVGLLMQNADASAGEAVFRRCTACHSGEKGGPNRVGPDLWDLVNRPIATHEGFSYSAAMTEFSEGGTVVWDWDHLNHFLHGPRQYINGTAMAFAGIPRDQERADLLAYLRSLSDNPAELPAPDAGATEAAAGEAPAEGEAAPAGETAPVGEAAPAEGAAPAGEAVPSAGPAETAPATTTNPTLLPNDPVSAPQAPAVTDPTVGGTPTAPPSGATPATGDNAVNAPEQAPEPQPAQPAPPATDPAAGAAPAPARPAQ